ncbi:hypothetical protein F5I97DRAFT_1923455 [Phlebopus sp. FC_14]|nr:hypothetical protein F5I97DRAFT_1923455 [Phlebopus sp. FC_14]
MSLPEAVAQSIWIRKSVGFAGSTCLWYDYYLTLDQEVAHIWNAPWTVYKVAFLVNRYSNLFGQTFTLIEETGWIVRDSWDFCERFNLFLTVLPALSTESIHIVVILRAWAIWGCKRRIAVILISIYLVYFLLMLGMMIFGSNTSDFQEFYYLNTVEICIDDMPPYVWPVFVASFILDTTVLGLTMWSLRQHLREFRHLYPSSFIRLLVRDASIFYLVSVLYNGFLIVAFTLYVHDPKSFLAAHDFCTPMLAIAGQHLVLNLRGLRVRSYSPRSISAEVDRQIAAFDEAQPEWWQNELDLEEIIGAEGSVHELQEMSRVTAQRRGDIETRSTTRDGVDVDQETAATGLGESDHCHHHDQARRKSTVSPVAESVIVEVRRMPGESHEKPPDGDAAAAQQSWV